MATLNGNTVVLSFKIKFLYLSEVVTSLRKKLYLDIISDLTSIISKQIGVTSEREKISLSYPLLSYPHRAEYPLLQCAINRYSIPSQTAITPIIGLIPFALAPL